MTSSLKMYTASDEEREIGKSEDTQDPRSNFRRDSGRILHSSSFRRLQGKMQLFPSSELDFIRNRLTHSLEVGQIAKSIASKINFELQADHQLDVDLVELAAWAHDLGHPPFGHTGEAALDACMHSYGGFEGNTQTLRILSKLEKRKHLAPAHDNVAFEKGVDPRKGLNLTYRSLASILKYDNRIPITATERENPEKICKGYYVEETELVENIKLHVLGDGFQPDEFKTIECKIMDIADDIAYATYDLEDAFKCNVLSPLDFYTPSRELLEKITLKVSEKLEDSGIERTFSTSDASYYLLRLFSQLISDEKIEQFAQGDMDRESIILAVTEHISHAQKTSKIIASNGYARTEYTSDLVQNFVNAIRFDPHDEVLALSDISIETDALITVEVLKHLAYETLVLSPDLKVVEYRGRRIIMDLFDILTKEENKGHQMLPRDFQRLYDSAINDQQKKRIICDFIAGMTDRYAVEYYGRLTSENPQSMFKRWY